MSETDRLNNFDLIRLFGAGQVAVSHSIVHLKADALLPLYYALGYLPGVPIFFVISGYLVSLSWERAPSWRQYALNRALRIYPALWTALALSIAILFACGVYPESLREFFLWVAAQTTIVQFYNPHFVRDFGVGVINGSAWTIPVELQFYIVLPFLYLFVGRNLKDWVPIMVLAAFPLLLGAPILTPNAAKFVGVTIIPWLFFFLAGLGLRYVNTRFPRLFVGRVLFWTAVYAMWVMVEIRFQIPGATENVLNPISIILLGGLTVSAAFSMPALAKRLLHDNDISYGLYIYHMPIVNLALFLGLVGVAGLMVAIPIAVGIAILSWKFIEKPALSLKHYSVHRRSTGH